MKRRLILVIAFAGLLLHGLGGMSLLRARASSPTSEDSGYANISVLTRALQLIRQDYVDDQRIGYRDLTYAALRGMLASLDPHSQFMEPQDFKALQDDTKGDFGGLGIVVSMREGVLTIVSPMEDTPGFKAGLLPGDQILKINGTSTEKLDISDAVSQLRGPVGEKVTLTILRPSTKEIRDFQVERAVIKVRSVKGERLLDSAETGGYRIGYVRLTQFNEPTAKELEAALDRLEGQGMQALVLDLRYNPGGLLNSAVDVCGLFLPPRQVVLTTEGRVASQRKVYRTPDSSRRRPEYPLAILINNGSASGSEIVAGALRDLHRAILVGETTFGKGSVQSVVQLPDGAGLRLTTAKYYTPSRQVIHEKGVTPGIRLPLSPREERDVLLLRREELPRSEQGESLKDLRDLQLDRASDALRGMLVYRERRAAALTAGSGPLAPAVR